MIVRLVVVLILLALIAPAFAQHAPLPPDQAYPCWLIRWGAATLTQAQIDEYKAQASPQQIAAGRACLGLPPDGRFGKRQRKR